MTDLTNPLIDSLVEEVPKLGLEIDNSCNTSPLFPIHVIPFNKFKLLSQFPRYPGDKNLVIDVSTIDIRNSFIIFISHCWKRGWSGAEGYDVKIGPHPDTKDHEKFKLTVKGIQLIIALHASSLQNCYVWLDFGCINQDTDPCQELKQLSKIVQLSDCIFTPIVDNNHKSWKLNYSSVNGLISDYKSLDWTGHEYSYVNRAWCRMEMLFAANVPLADVFDGTSSSKLYKFDSGLRTILGSGRRAHFLYGTKEFEEGINPLVLEPLQNSYLNDFNPANAAITKTSDRIKIKELMLELEEFITRVEPSYVGDINKNNEFHGKGKLIYTNGSVYEGEWKNNSRHGKGIFTFPNGDKFEGDWKHSKRNGFGIMKYCSGDSYEGDWRNDMMFGYGTYKYGKNIYYEGGWKNNKKHGMFKNLTMYINDELINIDDRTSYEKENCLSGYCDCCCLLSNIICCCLPSFCMAYSTKLCWCCVLCGGDIDDPSSLWSFFIYRNCFIPIAFECCECRRPHFRCFEDCDLFFPCCFSLNYNKYPKPISENRHFF